MNVSRAPIILMMLCLAAGATSPTSVYRNTEFGVVLPIPSKALLCPVPDDRTHHGATFLLGSRDVNICTSASTKRSILIWAEYNSAEESKTLHSFLKSECEYALRYRNTPNAACGVAPAGLNINGLHSESARLDGSDGAIGIMVAAQAGHPDLEFDASVPSINYVLVLYTNASHLDEDVAVFRTMLNTVRIAPKGKED